MQPFFYACNESGYTQPLGNCPGLPGYLSTKGSSSITASFLYLLGKKNL